ncbi:AIF_collapsed_G0031320.mRNA.1.CDS.1 [Saccharomyces cerevisiae]|nr:AIF_collapsed_G0031320.mRNA.1.CDS.1 [Saccharomyces cerevisiae]
MVTFRSIAIKKMMDKLGSNGNNVKNGSLPKSFEALSTFDADDERHISDDVVDKGNNFRMHQTIHKSLFNKFAQYRENNAKKIQLRNYISKGLFASFKKYLKVRF